MLRRFILACFVLVGTLSLAQADVFNMGPHVTSLETVHVGDPGNVADTTGYGSVEYTYKIGKYEVTAAQYTEFLNAVAGVDIYALYNSGMSNTSYGSGIVRNGDGTLVNPYTYIVSNEFSNRPINHVSFWNACRFCNWLHNGQPTGAQDLGTTETGAYTLNGYTGSDGRTIQRTALATWVIPTEDEWYKAAYYKGGGIDTGYWDYPTSSDSEPGYDLTDASGNNANYNELGKYTTAVGEFQASGSPYGTFDQGGNVWEWNEAVVLVDSDYSTRGLRGGLWYGPSLNLHASVRDYSYPSGESVDFPYLGFRVVMVPEPSTIILSIVAALCSAAFLAKRRR